MKIKKIVSGILCAALLGAAGASFVSCDDREADIRTELKGEMGEVQGIIDLLEEQLEKLEDQYRELKECACDPTLGDRVTNIEEQITNHEEWITNINELIENLQSGVSEERVLELLEDYAKKAEYVSKTELEEALKKYYTKQQVDDLFVKKEDLRTAVDSLIYEKDSILLETLEKYLEIDSLETEVVKILEDGHYATWEWVQEYVRGFMETDIIPYITEALENHTRELLLNMVTSIEINGTENPIFGGAALPADVRTTVLAAYHGVAPADIEFPQNWDKLNIGTTITPFTKGAGKVLINEEEGNAGTLYLTINPSSVDFNGKEVALVTSQNNEAPIKLSPLANSEKELMFGFTRTKDNPNGFYEAKATLGWNEQKEWKDDDIKKEIEKARMNIDFNNLKSSVKDVLEQRSKSSIAKLAANLFSESSDILPAYAVKTTYKTNVTDDDDELIEANVLSQYSIAATTVKPLSFSFMEGVQYDIPGIERIEKTIGDAIDNAFGQIKSVLPDFSRFEGLDTNLKIEFDPTNFESVTVHIYFELDLDIEFDPIDAPVYDSEGNEIGRVQTTVKIDEESKKQTVNQDVIITGLDAVFGDMVDQINNGLDLGQLSDALESLTSLSNVGSDLDDMRDDLKNKVFGYIDRLNSAFNTLTGSVNAALQPCLLFLDNKGNVAGRVSTSKLGTQVHGTSITLVPTSYTAELFAPAFKKFVAVTAVNGEGGSACAKYNTGDFGKVISGNNWNGLELKGLEAGNTYEITYIALDYSGVERTKTYYISVK